MGGAGELGEHHVCGVGVGCDIGLVVFVCVWGTVAAAVAFVVVVRRSSTQSWGR